METCQSCELVTNLCKYREELPFKDRTNPKLYKCHDCQIIKCNNCIGNIKLRYVGDNTEPIPGWKSYHFQYTDKVPEGFWIEFYSRRFLCLHSCSQKCHDKYEELD